MDLAELATTTNQLEAILRLQTFPLAVRMLRSEAEIPPEAKRPLRDLGHHYSACQCFSFSRRQGWTMAQLLEDNWCFEPVVGFGLVEPPEYFLDGNNRYPDSASSPEAGQAWARSLPRLKTGQFVGVLSAPMSTATFEPDLIMIYCDPSQMLLLLQAKNWIDGLDVESKLSGHAACVYAVAPVIETGQWQITVPCLGDRTKALARDDEMIVSLPTAVMPRLLEAVQRLQEKGRGLPLRMVPAPEYELAPAYRKIGKLAGMDWLP